MKQSDRIALLVLAGLAALAGFGLMFSTYMLYDDEGYVLFSLRDFVADGGLYDRVFSQYGPFFFLWNQVLHAIGHDFSHTAGRLITLGYWFGATGCCTALVWRWTRSGPATACALAATFLHLWPLINEPSHPGGLIVFVVALAAWLGAAWIDQPHRLAALAGAAGTALLFTKVNVGLFLLAGAGLWWWLHLVVPKTARRLHLAIALGAAVLLPIALMRSHWRVEGVATFIVIASTAAAGAVLAAWRGASPRTGATNLVHGGFTSIGLAALTVGLTLAQGTTPSGFFDGWLLQPLRFPSVFLALHQWRPGALPLAIVSAAAAGWLAWPRPKAPSHLLAWLRLGVAAAGGITLLSESSLNSQAFCLSYGLALGWVFVLPLGDQEKSSQPVRSWLALLLVTQALHAFPVAGSQISWGTFLWIPLALIGGWEAARHLAAAGYLRPRWSTAAAVFLVAAFTVRCGTLAWTARQRLATGDALGLRGTAGLELPERTASALRMLTVNAQWHADLLFSLPGLYSFNLWTDRPAPTGFNATHWFTLLRPEQQEAIRRRLDADPRAVVIVEGRLLDFLLGQGIATETPLTTWLRQEFTPAFKVDTHEFWVRRGRTIPILNSAELFESDVPGRPRYRITLTLPAGQAATAAVVELRTFAGDTSHLLQSWRTAQPEASHRREPSDSPGAVVHLHVPTENFPRELNPETLYFVLRDASGHRVAEARMRR